VGNARDAIILQSWLEHELGPDAIDLIIVSGMDGVTAVPPELPAVVIYAAPLFPSRLHWLGVTAARKIVVCHPFEQERVRQQVDRWWRTNALASARAGDKYRLWRLNWSATASLTDLAVDNADVSMELVSCTELEFDGSYPQPLRVAQLDVSRRFDDWLEILLSEPSRAEVQPDDGVDGEATTDMVVLHLDGQSEPQRWPARRQIMRLDGDTFNVCQASDLTEGNDLVLLGSSDDRVATQRELFDMFVQNNYGLQQTLRVAEKWQEYVDLSVSKLKTAAELTRYLKSKKFDITQGAVHHWHAGRVIGPNDPMAIRLLAELTGVPSADKMSKMVDNAIRAIRSEHRKIGGDLRRAIVLSRGRDVSAVQIGSRRFSREMFDAMVQVCRVVRIDRPPHNHTSFRPAKTIQDVAHEFGIRHADVVLFTNSCERSMARSAFEDLNAFEEVLNVLVNGFYRMYADKSLSLKQVEAMLANIPASYAGDMSDVTKGKFESDYTRLYDGRKVDISRHIKVGKAHDPRYTLRLHFHWDAVATKMVIHHAGEHLPIRGS
jgi:hypothetical protein